MDSSVFRPETCFVAPVSPHMNVEGHIHILLRLVGGLLLRIGLGFFRLGLGITLGLLDLLLHLLEGRGGVLMLHGVDVGDCAGIEIDDLRAIRSNPCHAIAAHVHLRGDGLVRLARLRTEGAGHFHHPYERPAGDLRGLFVAGICQQRALGC